MMNLPLVDSLNRQHRKVGLLAGRLHYENLRRERARARIAAWTSGFSFTEVVAWSFAVGLLWATGRGESRKRAQTSRSVMRLANAGLLIWQFVNRARVLRRQHVELAAQPPSHPGAGIPAGQAARGHGPG